MAQDAQIMAAAYRDFQADRDARQRKLERQRKIIYQRLPEVNAIDCELRKTMARFVAVTFDRDTNTDAEAEWKALETQNRALQRQRARLLSEAGYAENCLDDTPACPLCQDTGFLRDGTLCSCLAVYCAREQNRRLSKLLDLGSQSFTTFSFDWYDTAPWPAYGRSPRENMKIIHAICVNYAHSFGRNSGNLLFSGPPGLGKTFLSACIAREVSDRGFSVVYDTAGHIFQQFERGKFGREATYDEDPAREVDCCRNCDLLIMDDIGTEMLTAFVQSTFYAIINDRLLSHHPTILSTNLSLPELERRYGPATASRLRGEYRLLTFFGSDIRILKQNP